MSLSFDSWLKDTPLLSVYQIKDDRLLEVTLRGAIKNSAGASDNGMVMDFGDISPIVKGAVIEQLDHQDLNTVTGLYTTAENLVHWIWAELLKYGLSNELLHRVRLWETETSFAEITQQEYD